MTDAREGSKSQAKAAMEGAAFRQAQGPEHGRRASSAHCGRTAATKRRPPGGWDFQSAAGKMIRRSLAALVVAAVVHGMPAGTIKGTVRAQGAPAAEPRAGEGGGYGSRRYKFVERIDYDRLQDFVVSIDQPVAGATVPVAGAAPAVVVQRDASFEPHVLPIAVGTGVRWPNEDDIYHNVFSMSDTKDFNLGLYGKEKTPMIVFDKVGRVDVFCGIHTQMHCIILVLPSPFFALADARGRYAIRNLPAGTYRLKAWQERVPSQVKDVVVPAEGEVTVDFVLGLGELPKY